MKDLIFSGVMFLHRSQTLILGVLIAYHVIRFLNISSTSLDWFSFL